MRSRGIGAALDDPAATARRLSGWPGFARPHRIPRSADPSEAVTLSRTGGRRDEPAPHGSTRSPRLYAVGGPIRGGGRGRTRAKRSSRPRPWSRWPSGSASSRHSISQRSPFECHRRSNPPIEEIRDAEGDDPIICKRASPDVTLFCASPWIFLASNEASARSTPANWGPSGPSSRRLQEGRHDEKTIAVGGCPCVCAGPAGYGARPERVCGRRQGRDRRSAAGRHGGGVQSGPHREVRSVTTDSNGNYRIENLRPGMLHLGFQSAGLFHGEERCD